MFGALLGSIVGGVLTSGATKKAEKISAANLAYQKEQQAKVEAANAPYIGAGQGAVANLTDPNAFMTSPGYNFRLQAGLDATAGNKAVNGLLRSGGALKALNNYAQGSASDEYGKWFGQNLNVANLGMQGINVQAGVARALGEASTTDADNRANAGLARANAWSQMAGQIGGTADRFLTGGMSSYGK